ncbi:MAG: FadR family transcriptional regulator [Clostridia bacterium]|nr:FadR family transcriptional regulator [Clostridia bacterium]
MSVNQKPEKLYIQTFRQIRGYITSKQLQPGDQLPTEQALCAELGVSRNVLREAIKSMELMGMVSASPGRGTVIQPFNLDFIMQNVLFFRVGEDDQRVREMFDIRRMLEMSYMRQAFYALTKDDVILLRRLAGNIRQEFEKTGWFTAADREFHMSLFRPLGNTILNSLLDAIWMVDEDFQLELKRSHLESSVRKHEAIVEALEQYDFFAFAKAMEAHFSSGKYTMAQTYEEY